MCRKSSSAAPSGIMGLSKRLSWLAAAEFYTWRGKKMPEVNSGSPLGLAPLTLCPGSCGQNAHSGKVPAVATSVHHRIKIM